jgi:hypothetical protein
VSTRVTVTVSEGPIPGIGQYNLNDGTDNRAGCGRIAGKTDHLDVLRYGAGVCAAGYELGDTRTRELWTEVTGDFDLDPHELTLLAEAVRCQTAIDDLEATVEEDGRMIEDAKGNIRTHPHRRRWRDPPEVPGLARGRGRPRHRPRH